MAETPTAVADVPSGVPVEGAASFVSTENGQNNGTAPDVSAHGQDEVGKAAQATELPPVSPSFMQVI